MGGARLVRYQLIAFVVVTVVGITYAMAGYVGLGRIFGVGQYSVSVDMPSVGGLYANAVVTERGVTVGKVDGVHLTRHGTRTGVVADISLNDGTRIPSDLTAAVLSTSAVGEQYLNLTPKTSAGPYLTAGAVIGASEVSLPPSATTLLDDLGALLRSVPRKQLSATINELYNAFNGTAPSLRRLLDSSDQLLNSAQQNLAPTRKLIAESQTVLKTQADNSASIRSFSRNLNLFTTQLRDGNRDLAGALEAAPGTITQLNDLIAQLRPTLPLLLDNLTSAGQVLRVYLPNLREFLVVFPAAVNDLASIYLNSPIPHGPNVDVPVEVTNPCTTGYPRRMRQPDDTGHLAAPARTPYCTAPKSSQQVVRGARNDPCPNDPSLRSPFAAGCGLRFGTGAGTGTAAASADGASGNSAAAYDPADGLLVGPDGLLYSVGPGSLSGNGPTTVGGLLRQTLGS